MTLRMIAAVVVGLLGILALGTGVNPSARADDATSLDVAPPTTTQPAATSDGAPLALAPASQPAPGDAAAECTDVLTVSYGPKVLGRVVQATFRSDGKDVVYSRDRLAAIELSPDRVALADGGKRDGTLVSVRFLAAEDRSKQAKFKRDEIKAVELGGKGASHASDPGLSKLLHEYEIDKDVLTRNNDLYTQYEAKAKEATRKDVGGLKDKYDKQLKPLETRLTAASGKYDNAKAKAATDKELLDRAAAAVGIYRRSGGNAQAVSMEARARKDYQRDLKDMETAQSDMKAARDQAGKIAADRTAEQVKINARGTAQSAGLRDVFEKHAFVLLFGGKLAADQMESNFAAELNPAPAGGAASPK